LGPSLPRVGAALRGLAAVAFLLFAVAQPIGVGASAAGGAVERAVALQAAGRPALALEALASVPPGDPLAARGVIEGLRGTALRALGRHGEAEAAFAASIERARARGDLATALRSRINLAIVLNETGRAARASIALEAAHRAASAAGHGDAALLAATNAVEFEAADTARWLQRALDAEERAPADARTAAVRVRLARLLVDRGAANPARIGAILARAEEAGPPPVTLAEARLARGRLRAARGDEAAALDLYDRAALLADRAGATALRARSHWQAGQLRAALGNAAALADYRRTLALVVELRRREAALAGGGDEIAAVDVERAFREFLGLLLEEAGDAEGTTRKRLLDEVRTTIEQLRSFELQRYFADDCVDRLQRSVRAVEAVSPTTAVYYALLTPTGAYALLAIDGELVHRALPVDVGRLETTAQAFRRAVENRASNAFFQDGRQLYEWLLRPWQAELKRAGVETLVFIADGALRNVPLAALHDGERFVAERFAVATVPGLSLVDPRPVAGRELDFLLAALSEPVEGFAALPYTLQEVGRIRDLFGGVVLENAAFSPARLSRELEREPFSVVHIASHGVFGSSGEQSFILTHDGRLSLDQLDRLLRVTRFRETPVELLTLSACRTAAGDEQAALGLAGIAVKAGARSAVASLWSIEDESAAELLATFYRELATGDVSRAEALRRAQVAQLESERFRHPAYWAPFLVIGNWL